MRVTQIAVNIYSTLWPSKKFYVQGHEKTYLTPYANNKGADKLARADQCLVLFVS